MSRFYGGFQSYIISQEFENCSKWVMDSHSKREDESSIEDLNILPRMSWKFWMIELSSYKYAVHMMPVFAAGTFMLNCAYYGIPCIAPNYVDTQLKCFPDIQISSAEDMFKAREWAELIYLNENLYNDISDKAKQLSRDSYHINNKKWLEHMMGVIYNGK